MSPNSPKPNLVRVNPSLKSPLSGELYDQIEPESDKVLARFDLIRTRLISELIKNPDSFLPTIWEFLSLDRNCKFKMGTDRPTIKQRLEGNIHQLTSNRFFKCPGCQLIERIKSPKLDPIKPFSPEYGIGKDSTYSLLKIPNVYPKVIETYQQGKIIDQVINQDKLAQACQPHLRILAEAKYYSLDSFTNRLLITWYLEKVLEKSQMPHLRKIFYAYICGGDGYFLMEESQYVHLTDLPVDRKMVFSLLLQISGLFHRLRNYDLSFQNINSETILFENKKCNYQYDGVNITGNWTLKINDLSEAGMSVSPIDNPNQIIRIYRSTSQSEKRFQNGVFKSVKWGRHYELSNSPGRIPKSWVSYKVSDEGLEKEQRAAFLYANRMGLPLYQSSFDIYRIMLILVSNPQIYQILTEDPELSQIWSSFWIPSEFYSVQDKIQSYQVCLTDRGQGECSLAVALTGLTLRCDIVNHMWSQLKSMS